MRRLILIDGNAIAYRGYFAFIRNPLINSRGVDTSAAFGFTNSLIKLLSKTSPSHIGCVFDTPVPTFRHKLYSDYKATRNKTPDALINAFPMIHEILNNYGVPILKMEGYEADDVIGTLAKKAASLDYEVGIFSADKDFYQLVSNNIKVLHPKTFEWFGDEQVKEKMGVYPNRIIDLLALMGDSSDNVPGVHGIGPKTAVKLLDQFDTVDALLNSVDKVTQKKAASALQEYSDLARLSYQLVTIDCDAPVNFDEEAFRVREPNKLNLLETFRKLEFASLYRKYTD